MSEAYNVWNNGHPAEMRAYAIEQDTRFQQAMRKELAAMAADRGLRLVDTEPRPKPQLIRDVITIAQTVPSEVPMTDAQRIMKEVCAKHKITKAELIGRQRSKPIAIARHEACYRLKKETTLSLPQIGRKLGGRDHTTVIHGFRAHIKRMEAGGA